MRRVRSDSGAGAVRSRLRGAHARAAPMQLLSSTPLQLFNSIRHGVDESAVLMGDGEGAQHPLIYSINLGLTT